ncbi:MAG: c-type cytochrome, partial [Terriglobia bacterium]
ANGRRLFKKDGCYECHGFEAQGSPTTGPRLGPDPIPLEVLIQYVRKPTGQMPPYTDKVISDKELADIYAFLKSLPQPPAAKTIPLLH